MSAIFTFGVMMLFMQGILLLTMILKMPDLSSIGNMIQYFWPIMISIACFAFHFLVEKKDGGSKK